jgi:hypothetical protein
MILSAEQLLQLENLDLKITIASCKEDLQKERLNLLAKDTEILKLRIDSQKKMVHEFNLATENARESRRKLVKQIAAEHNLKGSWGFDPMTGEIIQADAEASE